MSKKTTRRKSAPINEGPLNVVIWGHSDQSGGAELACVIAKAFVGQNLSNATVAIISPKPRMDTVERFFSHEPFRMPPENVIESRESLRLGTAEGSVDAEATYRLLEEFRKDLPVDGDLLSYLIGSSQAKRVKARIHPKTLMISCGEPVAVKVAKDLGLTCIIVTDHLLTATVRWVLQHGGLFDREAADILTVFEKWDRMADEAFLAPAEFGGADYDSYLAHGSVNCNYVGGLFYEPLMAAGLRVNPSYLMLKRLTEDQPLVFVFGGGGPVWLTVYEKLYSAVQREGLKGYSLLLPTLIREGGSSVRKRNERGEYVYTLYGGGDALSPMELPDPGRLMYWYAACGLFVGRGGLAAQQIFATMMSDIPTAPDMLFVEEPGHPQIEHERRSLYNLGFVQTRTLLAFKNAPLRVIGEIIAKVEKSKTRFRVKSRYAPDMLDNVARALLESYAPVSVPAANPPQGPASGIIGNRGPAE